MFDINKIRADFPILNQKIYNKPFVYFDNGATTQKPQIVIDRMVEIFTKENSNIHRGVHYLSGKMTESYENARAIVKNFINAKYNHEIIFTSGTTGSINALAFSFGEKYISEGDEILISALEHHANIVPWQMLCERKNAILKVIPINDKGEIIFEEYEKLLSDKTKIVAVNHISNSLGTINPIKEIIAKAHEHNIPVLIDGAQSIQHTIIDVQELDCDFFAFSGHKVYGPNGIGVLYGKEKYLEEMPPYQGGGDMVKSVTFEKTIYNRLPFKFEAGTTNYTGAVGLGTAIEYIQSLGIENIANYEAKLLQYANKKLAGIENLTIYGTSEHKASVISFLVNTVHHYDTGMILDKLGIAVRTGTHCTEPIMQRFNIQGTVRASMCFYNTIEEIDLFVEAIIRVKKMFGIS
ncbi:MAG TPA: cysteine desulfurase CsdA [Bacteroidales bacterium]|nr:MAG: cysteine sulfinate desulfinase [Bacteroidetes bacterium GWF2_33_38]OFY87443.1 MAG: cysteine sulfinate desulfinase [Bacteroidetes bacterium RIFOXYA2_FULL_33_7]HBF88263.1 cysteine desulfurase CsdA [Bacteroidales bacterium]